MLQPVKGSMCFINKENSRETLYLTVNTDCIRELI